MDKLRNREGHDWHKQTDATYAGQAGPATAAAGSPTGLMCDKRRQVTVHPLSLFLSRDRPSPGNMIDNSCYYLAVVNAACGEGFFLNIFKYFS